MRPGLLWMTHFSALCVYQGPSQDPANGQDFKFSFAWPTSHHIHTHTHTHTCSLCLFLWMRNYMAECTFSGLHYLPEIPSAGPTWYYWLTEEIKAWKGKCFLLDSDKQFIKSGFIPHPTPKQFSWQSHRQIFPAPPCLHWPLFSFTWWVWTP